jgi:hypothetical protein
MKFNKNNVTYREVCNTNIQKPKLISREEMFIKLSNHYSKADLISKNNWFLFSLCLDKKLVTGSNPFDCYTQTSLFKR